MTICVAGKSAIAVETLQTILQLQGDQEIVAVATATDDGIDRWQPSLIAFCRRAGVSILPLQELYTRHDLIFLSLEFDKILLPFCFSSTARLYNLHFSALPAYKGMYTSCLPLLQGEASTGCTLHLIDAGIDTGDIVAQRSFSVAQEETAKTLYARYCEVGAELMQQWLPRLIGGKIEAQAQPARGSTYHSRHSIDYRHLRVELRCTADELRRQVNAYNHRSYQLASVDGRPISLVRILAQRSTQRPGTIVSQNEESLLVATIDYDCQLVVDRFDELLCAIAQSDQRHVAAILQANPRLIDESDVDGVTPLCAAVEQGDAALVRRLLSLGAGPGRRGCREGQLLIESLAGAPVVLRDQLIACMGRLVPERCGPAIECLGRPQKGASMMA